MANLDFLAKNCYFSFVLLEINRSPSLLKRAPIIQSKPPTHKFWIRHTTLLSYVSQIHAILPLVPIVFPIMWTLLDMYGSARLLAAFDKARSCKTALCGAFDSESSISEHAKVELEWRQVLHHFIQVFLGRSSALPRTGNLVHSMGTLTVSTIILVCNGFSNDSLSMAKEI